MEKIHLPPEAAAMFAVYVDSARIRAAIEGRTLIYTVKFESEEADKRKKADRADNVAKRQRLPIRPRGVIRIRDDRTVHKKHDGN
jgi:hypothetical protein